MRLLFNQVAVEEYQAGSSELQSVIQRKQQDQMTGLISSFYSNGSQLIFVLFRGNITNIYLHELTAVINISAEEWMRTAVLLGIGLIQVRPLPSSAVRLGKLLIEQVNYGTVESVDSVHLPALLDNMRQSPASHIVHLRWEAAEGIFFTARQENLIKDAFMVTPDRYYSLQNFQSAISRWDGTPCVITSFPNEVESPSWAEFYLHHAFVELTSRLLSNYERFTGRILVAAIARDLHVTAEKAGWNILVEHTRVNDQTIFSVAEEAARAYRQMIAAVYRHMGAVVGNKLIETITIDACEEIGKSLRKVIINYSLVPAAILPLVEET